MEEQASINNEQTNPDAAERNELWYIDHANNDAEQRQFIEDRIESKDGQTGFENELIVF